MGGAPAKENVYSTMVSTGEVVLAMECGRELERGSEHGDGVSKPASHTILVCVVSPFNNVA
jgi:hypothetical protein